ncbi:MAG: biotin/lipoate A/B protein ligase family protein [Verrucomicrobiota bacterium]|nr:biotin/lipoate A/B protein ligase family protein [Verrucomicrobiota bacterium]
MNKQSWYFLGEGRKSPSYNMAMDELLLSFVESKPVLRIYDWDVPTISIGYSQRLSEINTAGYRVVRRYTGGGVVFHDTSYTYSLVFPSSHLLVDKARLEGYKVVNEAVMSALLPYNKNLYLYDRKLDDDTDLSIMACAENPTFYDVMKNSEKVSGCAQRRNKNGLLVEGYIKKIALAQESLEKALKNTFAEYFNCSYESFPDKKDLFFQAEQLAKKKYLSKEWNFKR